jgi:transporter family-2 protein
MIQTALVILIGLIGGVAVGIQSPISASMGNRIGPVASSVIVHLGGLLASLLLLIVRRGEKIQSWANLPAYMLLAGVFGLILIVSISYTLPKIGAGMMIALIVAGQLTAGILIDHFGWLGVPVRPINLSRVAGVMILLAGSYLISRS